LQDSLGQSGTYHFISESISDSDKNPFEFQTKTFAAAYMSVVGVAYDAEKQMSYDNVEKLWNLHIERRLHTGRNNFILHLVTRFKRDVNGMLMERSGFPVLEFVAIKRKSDSVHWAIPEVRAEAHFDESRTRLYTAQEVREGTAVGDDGKVLQTDEKMVYRKSPVEYIAFHDDNLREDVSAEQADKIKNEMRLFFGKEPKDIKNSNAVLFHRENIQHTDLNGNFLIQEATQKAILDDLSERSEDFGGFEEKEIEDGNSDNCIYNGFIDDHRNSGAAWINASVFHYHDSEGFTDAFDLKYPGSLPAAPKDIEDKNFKVETGVAEVAWLSVHSHLDLIGEQERLLEYVARKMKAFW